MNKAAERKKSGLTSSACPVCRSRRALELKKIAKYAILKCVDCRLEFASPMPSRTELAGFYANYSDVNAGLEALKLNAQKNIEHLKKYGLNHKTKLLDFGCGKNVFAQQGDPDKWLGYDPYSREAAEDRWAKIKGQKWEFITLWGVFEHLVDPAGQLAELKRLLAPRGKIVLTTVTTESAIPYRHKPPEHVTYWTRAALAELARSVGLKILECSFYRSIQAADVYLSHVLRTVPAEYKAKISHRLPKYLRVPTNEIFVVMEKK